MVAGGRLGMCRGCLTACRKDAASERFYVENFNKTNHFFTFRGGGTGAVDILAGLQPTGHARMSERVSPGRISALFDLLGKGALDQVEAGCEQVLREQSDNVDAMHLSGLVCLHRGHYPEALERLQEANRVAGGRAEILNSAAEVLRLSGDAKTAAIFLLDALGLNPAYAPAHINYGLVLLALDNPGKAEIYFRNALALLPTSSKAHYYLGRLLLREERAADALVHLRLAVENNPAFAEAHFELGMALRALGDTRGARGAFSRSLELEPGSSRAWYLRGMVRFELADDQGGLDDYRRAAELNADYAPFPATHAESVRYGSLQAWCADHKLPFVGLARPQWLNLAAPVSLPPEEAGHFYLMEPFAARIFLAQVNDARVLPGDLLVTSRDRRLFIELVNNAYRYLARERLVRLMADDGRVMLAVPAREVVVDQACVYLGSAESVTEWVFECLSRLWVVSQMPAQAGLPLVVESGLDAWQREMLALMGYGPERLVEVPPDAALRVRELHVPSLLCIGPFIAPVAVQHLRREFRLRVPARAGGPRRIYLTRQSAATRRILNEPALLPSLRGHGFTVVDPAVTSIAELAAMYQGAEVVLGVEGAALAPLFVAPPATRVGVIASRGRHDPLHHYAAAPVAHDFTYLVADPDFASHDVLGKCDMVLPESVLEAFLAKLPA
jgi:tetratricopeptide (TPR) repeat protein